MRLSIVLIGVIFFGLRCESDSSLKVATSANMQFAMEEIVFAFEKENNIPVDLIISSSGKLSAQIEHGAPFDLFVAANMKYPKNLYQKKLTQKKPEIYAMGQLVMWTLNDYTPSFELLLSDEVDKIAIANPKTAPYGEATIEVLKKEGIYEKIKHKLVFAESISQCNQFITSRSVDVGFTARAVVNDGKMKNSGNWTAIDNEDHSPINQGAVILKNSKNDSNTQLFYNFLFGDKSKDILNKYGYLIPKNE